MQVKVTKSKMQQIGFKGINRFVVVVFLISCSLLCSFEYLATTGTRSSSDETVKKKSSFVSFVNLFQEIKCDQAFISVTPFFYLVGHDSEDKYPEMPDSIENSYTDVIIPFFKEYPTVKYRLRGDWVLVTKYEYDVFNTSVGIINVMIFDTIGQKKSQLLLPLYREYGLSDWYESTRHQASVFLGGGRIIHRWYIYSTNGKSATVESTMYELDSSYQWVAVHRETVSESYPFVFDQAEEYGFTQDSICVFYP